MIESKVSRSDFKADAKKSGRVLGVVGTYRFYITPLDMVSPDEIPKGWGLLYGDGKKNNSSCKTARKFMASLQL